MGHLGIGIGSIVASEQGYGKIPAPAPRARSTTAIPPWPISHSIV
jgi:hypothetical protein